MLLMSSGNFSFSRFSGDDISLSTASFNVDCGSGREPSLPEMGTNFM